MRAYEQATVEMTAVVRWLLEQREELAEHLWAHVEQYRQHP